MNPKELDGVHYYSPGTPRRLPKIWTHVYKPNKYGCGCAVLVSYCDDLLKAEWRYVSMCKQHYNIDAATSEASYRYNPNHNPHAEWHFPDQRT